MAHRNKFLTTFSLLLAFVFLTHPKTLKAVTPSLDCDNSGCTQQLDSFQGLGPLSKFINDLTPDSPAPATSMFTKILSITVGVMTIVAFLWFIFVLFSGTLSWLTSGGDKAKLQEAQKKLTSGLIGLILTFSAIFIIKIIGTILGFDILDLTTIVGGLWK